MLALGQELINSSNVRPHGTFGTEMTKEKNAMFICDEALEVKFCMLHFTITTQNVQIN